MTNKELIKAWRNDKSRREWLNYYRDWDTGIVFDDYGLEFFEFKLPDGRTLIAMEHNQKVYNRDIADYVIDRRVFYYIIPVGRPFIPERWSESAVAGELMVLKTKMQKEG